MSIEYTAICSTIHLSGNFSVYYIRRNESLANLLICLTRNTLFGDMCMWKVELGPIIRRLATNAVTIYYT